MRPDSSRSRGQTTSRRSTGSLCRGMRYYTVGVQRLTASTFNCTMGYSSRTYFTTAKPYVVVSFHLFELSASVATRPLVFGSYRYNSSGNKARSSKKRTERINPYSNIFFIQIYIYYHVLPFQKKEQKNNIMDGLSFSPQATKQISSKLIMI